MTTLMNERSALGASGNRRARVPSPTPCNCGRPGPTCTPVLRDRLTQLWLRAEAQRLTSERSRAAAGAGGPGPEGSIGKLVGAELNQSIYAFCMDLLGPEEPSITATRCTARTPATTGGADPAEIPAQPGQHHRGGTSEVMRNILGERVLGLPATCVPMPASRGRRSPWLAAGASRSATSSGNCGPRWAGSATRTSVNARHGGCRNREPFDTGLWRRLGSELGVLGLSVSEDDGGAGGCLVDQAVAVEEFGASLTAGPLFGTVYLAIPALAACPRTGPDEPAGRPCCR